MSEPRAQVVLALIEADMHAPAEPPDQSAGIHMLGSPDISNTLPDERFEGLARLARRHFGVAGAVITLLGPERQWFSSCEGFSSEVRLHYLAILGQVILGDEILVVPDTLADRRFNDHPRMIGRQYLRFYAGCPVTAPGGRRIGTVYLLDNHPRDLDGEQREFLSDLARLVAVIAGRDSAGARFNEDEGLLRENERRMMLAISESGTGVWDRNVPTKEIHYSTGWKAMLGYAESEISNLSDDSYKRVHPDDLAYVQAAMQAHFDRKTERYEVQHRLRCKDGSYKWVSSRGRVVGRDSEGAPLRMIGTTTDITAMREMSEKLRHTVDLMTSLTDEVPGLVFQYRVLPNGESFFSYASAGIRDIYEITPEQVAVSAAVLNEIVHPDDLCAYRASLDASAANLTPWHLEYRVQLPGQGLRWRQGDAQPRRLEDGSTLWYGFIRDVTEQKRIEAELQEFATIDSLTQLPNRRHFMAQIEAELALIQRDNDRSAAVLMCDLDHFKSINDRWGHAVGDLALRHFSTILLDELRKTDIAGRIGGEEFAFVLRNADIAQALTFARRVQQRISETPLLEGGLEISVTFSAGISLMNASDASTQSSLSRSDRALYRAKKGGRNRIECD